MTTTADPVPMLDTAASWAELAHELEPAVLAVLRSGRWVLGETVARFEREVAAVLDVPHAIGVASGTDALQLALMALDVRPGDEVVTTPFTFFATASTIARLGAVPVFADVREDDLLLDVERVESVIGPRTRVVLPVHLYGQCVDPVAFADLAHRRGIALLEDAAQAIGGARAGVMAGSLGALAAFSFYPTKNLGAAGDGGLVTTRDADLAERVRCLREHGARDRYHHLEIGLNSRLDAVQAAILSVRLRHLAAWNAARDRVARTYDTLLGEAGLLERVRPLARAAGGVHVWHQYVVRVPRREDVRDALHRAGIGCAVYYPVPLHLQPCFAHLGGQPGDLPVAERAAAEVLALPIHPGLRTEEQERVVATLAGVLGD